MALGTIGKIAARVTENPPMPECMERIKNIYFSFVTVLAKRVRCGCLPVAWHCAGIGGPDLSRFLPIGPDCTTLVQPRFCCSV
jgi:hypothetical protein